MRTMTYAKLNFSPSLFLKEQCCGIFGRCTRRTQMPQHFLLSPTPLRASSEAGGKSSPDF